jgi:hypothetical protein
MLPLELDAATSGRLHVHFALIDGAAADTRKEEKSNNQ